MNQQVREHLVTQIEKYCAEHGLTYSMPCPFPVSWGTIGSVRNDMKKKFTKRTTIKLLEFFNKKNPAEAVQYEWDFVYQEIVLK